MLSGCSLVAVLVDVVMMGQLPELDSYNRPTGIFGQTIHDNCERRGHFENGEFVYEYGSMEEALGYCLYPLGCKGPQTHANCSVAQWNHGRSWCVKAGAPCIGCCEADPMNPSDNWVQVHTPFAARLRDLRIGDLTFSPDVAAGAVTGVVAAALVAHGVGMKLSGRMDGGAPFEKVRAWDAKHPDKSIGDYGDINEAIAEQAELDASLKAGKKGGQE